MALTNLTVQPYTGEPTSTRSSLTGNLTTTPTLTTSYQTGIPDIAGALRNRGIEPSSVGNYLNGGIDTTTPTTPAPVVNTKPSIDITNKEREIVTQSENRTTQPMYDNVTGELTPAGIAAGLTPMSKGEIIQPEEPYVPKTAEERQLDEIDHPGEKLQYNLATGDQEWAAIGTPGYSEINPNKKINNFTEEADAGTGITIRKLSDGTYARYNATTGTYAGQATATEFTDAQTVQDIKKLRDDALKGIYSKSQQAQINGVVNDYQNLINEQKLLNKGAQGGAQLFANMTGMGGQLIGQNLIQATITNGLKNVASFITQREGAVEKMKQGFLNDDIELLKVAYSQYTDSQDKIQNTIDNLQAKAEAEKEKNKAIQKDQAITEMYDNGITDPLEIASQLVALGYDVTSADVANTLSSITKGLADNEKLQQDVLNNAQTMQDYRTAEAVMKLDPKSPTFKQDLAKLQGGMRAKATQVEKDQYEIANLTKQFEKMAGATYTDDSGKQVTTNDRYVDPFKYLQLRATSNLSPTEFDNRFAHYINPKSAGIVGFTTKEEPEIGALSASDMTKGINYLMNNGATQEQIDRFKTDRQAQAYILDLVANS